MIISGSEEMLITVRISNVDDDGGGDDGGGDDDD